MGGVFSCMNKGQRDNKGAAQSKPESKPSGKPEIKCGICGKEHLTIKCYKNPDRKQAYSAEIASGNSGSKGSNTDSSIVAQGMQYRNDDAPNRGRGFGRGHGAGRGFTRGRGKSDGTSRGAGHQMSFCKTEINRESDDGIGSIYQNKVDSSLNSEARIRKASVTF